MSVHEIEKVNFNLSMTIDPKTHERLNQINAELTVIEKQIHERVIRLDTVLQNELHNGVDGMYDYELEVEIICYSGDESEDLLCTLLELQKGISLPSARKKSNLADGENHNIYFLAILKQITSLMDIAVYVDIMSLFFAMGMKRSLIVATAVRTKTFMMQI